MRAILIVSAAVSLSACSQPSGDAAGANATAQPEQKIESSTAPAVGGPAALPTDGGVTPAPDAMADASAAQVGAAVSPAEAARRSGGEQNAPR